MLIVKQVVELSDILIRLLFQPLWFSSDWIIRELFHDASCQQYLFQNSYKLLRCLPHNTDWFIQKRLC